MPDAQPDPRAVVERYYDALNSQTLEALDELVAPGLVHHGLPSPSGRSALKQLLRGYRASFPDLTHRIEAVVVQGSRVAVRTTTTGTHRGTFLGHPPTGRRFSAAAQGMYELEDGAIAQIWEVFDTLGMLQQLGLYEPSGPSAAATAAAPAAPRGPGPGLPPGPSQAYSLAEIRSDPLGFLAGLVREHGQCVHYVCDGRGTILVNDPRAVRLILQDRAANYSKLGTPDLLLLKPMLGDGLLTTVGPGWKADRQLLQPSFTRRELEGSAATMVGVTQRMLERWQPWLDVATPINVVAEMSRLTLEIAARVLFSHDLGAQSAAFGRAMDVLNECMSDPQPGAVDQQARMQPALAFIRRTVWSCILARKFCDTGEHDALAVLLQAQRERGDPDGQVVDQAVTILLAGHETTAKALSWTIALIDQYPAVRARLLDEIDTGLGGSAPTAADCERLPYSLAVIHESLRLMPPIWLLTRTALEDDELLGYRVPAGTLVAISPYLLHRHADLWDQPDAFRPERFLMTAAAAQADRFLPFGYGPRHCIGRSLAVLEMPLVLATLSSRVELHAARPGPLEPEALVTLRPKDGLPMLVRSRAGRAPLANGRALLESAW